MKPIHVIGLGMDPADVSGRAIELVMLAEVLAGGKRHLDRFPKSKARRIEVRSPLSDCLAEIRAAYESGLNVAIVCGGDPLFFGLGRKLLETFGAGVLIFHPAPTATQTAAARLGLPYENIPSISLHGRPERAPLFSALARHGRVFVFTDPVNTPSKIAEALIARGAGAARMWVCEDLGRPTEMVNSFSLAEAATTSFGPLNLVLVDLPQPPLATLRLGLPDDLFEHEAGLITKGPVRAAAIAALRLDPDSTLWDLGAGCGAVGIEAGAVAMRGRIKAVERDPRRAEMIGRNAARFHAFHVEAVHGEMPGCLHPLAKKGAPDRIFIGGGLGGRSGTKEGRNSAVLREAMDFLAPGGRMVVAAVLLHTLETARSMLANAGWTVQVDMVQAAIGTPLAGDVQLKALNPVFLIQADKPGPPPGAHSHQ